jgi:hypothetical protein
MNVVERVRTLTDKQACYIAKAITQDVFANLKSPPSYEQMAKDVEPVALQAGVDLNLTGRSEWYAVEMESELSGPEARKLLEVLATETGLEEIIDQAMDRYTDKALDLGIISVGVAIALVYVAISSEIELDLGWIKIRKKGLNSEQQKEVAVKTLPEVAKALFGKGAVAG